MTREQLINRAAAHRHRAHDMDSSWMANYYNAEADRIDEVVALIDAGKLMVAK